MSQKRELLLLRWRHCLLIREDERPQFEEACIKATYMDPIEWRDWLNNIRCVNYATQCKYAKEVGLCTPGAAFFSKMRNEGKSIVQEAECHS
jgi:hypothetical protein